MPISRRDFVANSVATSAALLATPAHSANQTAKQKAIYAEIDKRHDESVTRLQQWLRQPSIAAENIGMQEGCDMMRRLALDAGFQHAE